MIKAFLKLNLILLLCTGAVYGQDAYSIQKMIEESPILQGHFVGFSLYDEDAQQYLVEINAHKHFTPASNTKVFTLYTALMHLGDSIPGLEYIIKGDSLLFWGTGDPTFLHSKLDNHKVYNFLKNSQKKLFHVASEAIEEPFYRNGWSIEDYDEYYQPEISSFPIYGNVATFRKKEGRLQVVPAIFQKAIQYLPNAAASFTLSRQIDSNVFFVNSENTPAQYVNEKPFKYSSALFVELLADTLKKSVTLIQYTKPNNTQILYSSHSREVLREMMLPSDNFLAEQFNMLAANQAYQQFKTAKLRTKMQNSYQQAFQDPIELRDGSGLSAYNKITPNSMVQLLLLIKQKVANEQDLKYLFPAGGVDGTLKNAYSLDQGVPFVWAKTGTIFGVHCQSGYLLTRSGKRLIFSFLNNNFLGEAGPSRKEMVRIMSFIRRNY